MFGLILSSQRSTWRERIQFYGSLVVAMTGVCMEHKIERERVNLSEAAATLDDDDDDDARAKAKGQ